MSFRGNFRSLFARARKYRVNDSIAMMAQTELITVKATINPLLTVLECEGCSAAGVVDEELDGIMVVGGDVIEPGICSVGAEVLG